MVQFRRAAVRFEKVVDARKVTLDVRQVCRVRGVQGKSVRVARAEDFGRMKRRGKSASHTFLEIATPSLTTRLVMRDPRLYAVTVAFKHHASIMQIIVHNPWRAITSILEFKVQRNVPMKERRHGLETGLDGSVDQPVVEIEALFVRGPAAEGEDSTPADGETVGCDSHLFDTGDVFLVELSMRKEAESGYISPASLRRTAHGARG